MAAFFFSLSLSLSPSLRPFGRLCLVSNRKEKKMLTINLKTGSCQIQFEKLSSFRLLGFLFGWWFSLLFLQHYFFFRSFFIQWSRCYGIKNFLINGCMPKSFCSILREIPLNFFFFWCLLLQMKFELLFLPPVVDFVFVVVVVVTALPLFVNNCKFYETKLNS